MPMIEMDFYGIEQSSFLYKPIRTMVLKEKGKRKYRELRISIGRAEADAMVAKEQNIKVPRSLTYDLLCDVIAGYGGKVNAVVITEVRDNAVIAGGESSIDLVEWFLMDKLRDNTVFARLVIACRNHNIEVDCRPSDGVAVAIRTKVPIFVDSSVLDEFAIDTLAMPYPYLPPML